MRACARGATASGAANDIDPTLLAGRSFRPERSRERPESGLRGERHKQLRELSPFSRTRRYAMVIGRRRDGPELERRVRRDEERALVTAVTTRANEGTAGNSSLVRQAAHR